MKAKEFILATVVLIALVAAQILATHGRVLFQQPPWLDEVHTGILVTEPDAAKFRAAVSNECVDVNFPVYYQALRLFHVQSLAAIRGVSLVCALAALLAIYVLLRGSFSPLESAVGVLTVWSTPLIVYHSFQARFYVPWFAAVMWFVVTMRWTKTARIRWLAATALAVTSILACTLHVLGLPAIGLIVLAELLADSRPIKTRLAAALPAMGGLAAVVMFIPLMIEQKRSFAIPSWLVGNPIRLLYSTLGGIMPGVAATILILGVFATLWIRRQERDCERAVVLFPLAGMSSLIFFPIVLFAITLVAQPVLLSRYALIGIAPVAAAAAYAATRMHKCIIIAVCIALAAESGAEMSRRVREAVGDAHTMDAMISAIRADPNEMTLFESRHQLFPVVWTARDLVDRCAYVDFSPGPNQLDPVVEGFERDFAKKFQHVFGWPKVMAWDDVMRLPRFRLVAIDEDGERVERRFAGYRVERCGGRMFLLRRP